MFAAEPMHIPYNLAFQQLWVDDVAAMLNATRVGANQPIYYLGTLHAMRMGLSSFLTYANTSEYWNEFLETEQEVCLVPAGLITATEVLSHKTAIVLPDGISPLAAFYNLHDMLVSGGYYTLLPGYISDKANIHSTAVVHDHVVIEDNVMLGPNVVVYPNSVICKGSIIDANSTIGGWGFEPKMRNGRREKIDHAGGVYIGPNCQIGSNTCIDKSLFNFFTFLESEVLVDNLVHIGHNAKIRHQVVITACCEISAILIGRGAWIGPNSCTKAEIEIGEYAFVGLGSTVLRSVPPHTLVYGAPAKPGGLVCYCRQKIRFEAVGIETEFATCSCSKRYKQVDGRVYGIDSNN
jgi:UDP-3-O-[3-hydroxymyristoyl] glucosamine N-acyltransferase